MPWGGTRRRSFSARLLVRSLACLLRSFAYSLARARNFSSLFFLPSRGREFHRQTTTRRTLEQITRDCYCFYARQAERRILRASVKQLNITAIVNSLLSFVRIVTRFPADIDAPRFRISRYARRRFSACSIGSIDGSGRIGSVLR